MSNSITIKRLKFDSFIIAVIVGICHAVATRDAVDPDGVSYLEIADAYFKGDFQSAVNSYWSPFYSWVIGLGLHIFKPDVFFEATFIHIINSLIYIFAFFCFHFFLSALIEHQKKREEKLKNENIVFLPEWAWVLIGYSLFLWTSLNLITISHVTPDMFLSAFVYLIFGLILRIKNGNDSLITFTFLGLVMGLAYLTKAVMFPLNFVFLFAVLFSVENFKKTLPKIFLSLVVFLFISSPFIYALSKQKGYFTYGETGRVNYVWYLDESKYECWKEGSPGCKGVVRPAKKICDVPKAFDYSEHLVGSYPMWYDPTYWFTGLKTNFTLLGQVKVLGKSFEKYFNLFFQWQGFIVACCIVLFFMSGRGFKSLKDIYECWYLILPSIIVFLLYSLIIVQYRYLGPFIAPFWCGIFAALKFHNYNQKKEIIDKTVMLLVALLTITSIISQDIFVAGKNASAQMHAKVASAVRKLGVNPGDRVAVIGVNYGIYWTHLAKVNIVVEVPSEEEKNFWVINSGDKKKLFKKIKTLGGKIVVAEQAPSHISHEGWMSIKGTPYYIYLLKDF